MTHKEALVIFRSRYPEGDIFTTFSGMPKGRMAVTFNNRSKVYFYRGATYVELLSNVGFKIKTQAEIDSLYRMYEDHLRKSSSSTVKTIFGVSMLSAEQQAHHYEMAQHILREINDTEFVI